MDRRFPVTNGLVLGKGHVGTITNKTWPVIVALPETIPLHMGE